MIGIKVKILVTILIYLKKNESIITATKSIVKLVKLRIGETLQ